ncbi:MAG: D-2-hydroxyacid dehydrogenase [Halioglobus sp.]|nr:D-2-hydroxyacid dehydrogenase [Halioglobus sp.]
MTTRGILAALSLALVTLSAAADDFDPAPIIEHLSLREADTPMANKPGWAPKKIVAFLLPMSKETRAAYVAALKEAAGEAELVLAKRGGGALSENVLADVDAVIGMCTPILLKNAGPNLRWIHNYSVGLDHCKGATQEQLERITVTNNKRLSGPAIAEHSIAMLLSLTRDLGTYHAAQAEGRWGLGFGRGVTFGELRGKTMLVVGLGGIGTEIARRAHGLGMRVIATRNSSRSGPEFVEYVGLSDELHKLAGQADVIANALPLTPSTTGLFDNEFFAAAKPGALFLSVGRGKSTVTADLMAALESGQLWGAALDVTDPEPLPKGHPLWQMERVLITPHVSAAGADSMRRSAVIAAENLRRYVAGEKLLNEVDLAKGY